MSVPLWSLPLCLLLGLLGAWWVSRHGRLDELERRRLHQRATPRGGGIGIALAALLMLLLALLDPAQIRLAVALVGVSLAAVAGAWEDRHGLAARWRLLLHVCAAVLLVGALLPAAPWWLQLLLVIALAGMINLVNFMDGANGLVALQAVLCGLGMSALGQPLGLPLALAVLGFLPLNFPRARVFLGDVGSYVIGAWMALLWLLAAAQPAPGSPGGAQDSRLALLAWIGLAPLLLDSGWTLLTRILRGRRWYSAHREHLYQWAVRSGWSHARVSLAYALSVALLWTLAWYAQAQEQSVAQLWLLALLVAALLSVLWWWARFALLRLHRRQLRAARVLRRSVGSSIA